MIWRVVARDGLVLDEFNADERKEVRAFREAFVKIVERHNAGPHVAQGKAA